MAAGATRAQLAVRETMVAAGGYWRPLAACARLLEELGECSEQAGGEELPGELADLWIITTALADQFLAVVAEPGAATGSSSAEASLPALVAAAARSRAWSTTTTARRSRARARRCHRSRERSSASRRCWACSRAPMRSTSRPRCTRSSPTSTRAATSSASGARGSIRAPPPVLAQAPAEGRRLWGAPDAGPQASAEQRAALAREPLEMFAKAARAEALDGFLIAGPAAGAQAGEGAWLGELVAELDPDGDAEAFEVAAVALRAEPLVSDAGREFALVRPLG